MATHTHRWEVVAGQTTRKHSKDYTGGLVTRLDAEAVADAQTDKQITLSLDVSAVQAFYLVSDQAVTIETNNGSAPDDTLVLVANVPYRWTTDSYDTFKFTTDITALFVTNASGAAAAISLEAVVDPTP